ncbi:MAG: LacI family transcriptional regulator [Brooklawnia sp.]|nr:LacI family transcriptional regulator [Brooklawnia sp.]
MKDVAAMAGVSFKTVSRVINSEPGVAPETVEAVRRAADALGYQADLQARNLRRSDRRSQSIGLIVSSVANPFDAEVHAAIEEEVAHFQAVVLALSSGRDPELERTRARALVRRHVDGLLVAPIAQDQSWLLKLAGDRPVVFVDRQPMPLLGDAVLSDHRAGARRATEHLLGYGHRRVALLTDDLLIQSARERRDGYLDALAAAGIPADPQSIRMGLSGSEAARQACHQLFAASTVPTAIFAAQNYLAAGAMRAINDLGLTGRIALVAFDDLPYSDLFASPLTAVTQDAEQIGRLAAQRLLGRITGDISGPPEVTVVPTGFAVRGSGEVSPD